MIALPVTSCTVEVRRMRLMPWYLIVRLICLVIGPFDALYVYIKAGRRREELRRQKEESGIGTGDKESSGKE